MKHGLSELIKFFINKIKDDDIAMQAGALAYTSVLALVPAITIVLSLFTMVPSFAPIKEEVMQFASSNFLPVFQDVIMKSVTTFVAHAASMTVTGSLMLIIVSLMLIRAVDIALNRIWRGGKRKAAMTFSIYWTLLTVGPLAFGITIWVSTQLLTSALLDTVNIVRAMRVVYFSLPILVEVGMIFALYFILPVADVKVRDALIGAVIVTGCFEGLKRGFSTFIVNFSDYEAIYGAVAAIPVLMIWIYLNWWLILIGAELTAFLGKARNGHVEKKKVPHLIQSLINVTSLKHKHFQEKILEEEKPVTTQHTIHVIETEEDNDLEEKEPSLCMNEHGQIVTKGEVISQISDRIEPVLNMEPTPSSLNKGK